MTRAWTLAALLLVPPSVPGEERPGATPAGGGAAASPPAGAPSSAPPAGEVRGVLPPPRLVPLPEDGKPRGTVLVEVAGTVREVDRAHQRVTIDTGAGAVTLSIDRNTLVYGPGGLGTVLDLAPGAPVRAGRNADMVAYWLTVRPPAARPPSPAPGQGTGPGGGAGPPAEGGAAPGPAGPGGASPAGGGAPGGQPPAGGGTGR
jgi:hypothetical protein